MTETTSAPTQTTESVDEFAARARVWLAGNMPASMWTIRPKPIG